MSFFFKVLFSLVKVFTMNPLSSSLYLVCTLIFLAPLISQVSFVWFGYFISLLFLKGIFVLLIYFSSISSFFFKNLNGMLLIVLCTLFTSPFAVYIAFNVSNDIYFLLDYIFIMGYLILSLLLFLLFVSGLLGSGEPLRHM